MALCVCLSLGLFAMLVGALQAHAPLSRSPGVRSRRFGARLGALEVRTTKLVQGTTEEQNGLYARYVTLTVPLETGVGRRPRAVAVDASLGLAYLADGERGTVTIVAGTEWVDTITVGQEVADVAVDEETGIVYASVPDPYALYSGRVAVIHGGKVITRVILAGYPGPVAVDRLHHRAYVGVSTRGLFSDKVVVLEQERAVSIVDVPLDIVALDVDPEAGCAYVLSRAGPTPTLSLIRGTANAAVIPLEGLDEPRDVAVDPESGLIYVVGRSSSQDAGTALVITETGQSPVSIGPDPRRLAVDSEHGRVYVSTAGDDRVTVLAGAEVVATVRVGPTPDAIAVDPGRDRVYVSNTGSGTTTVLSEQNVVTTLPAGGGPLAVDTKQGVAYLAGNGLAVAEGDRLLGRLLTAAMPARITVNPETGLAYVANQGPDSLSVLSYTDVLGTLSLTGTPREIAADPTSGWAYVAQDTGLVVMRGATIEATLPIPARDVASDPLRGLTYAAGGDVAVIRGTEVIARVDVGRPPRRVAVNRATGMVYATGGGDEDGFVAVISGTQRINTITTGARPGKLVIDSVRKRVFVLHPWQGQLSVIQGVQRHFPSIFLPRPALDAAVDPLTGDVYVATRGPLVLVQGLEGDVVDLGLEALAVTVDPEASVAYATTRNGRVAVLDGANVVATVSAGHRPVDLAVDSESGRVYVANFGSDTVTVMERWQPPHVYLPLVR